METMAFTSHQDIFNRLSKVANLATLSPAERRQYDYDLKKARDYRAELKFAVKKSLRQGREEKGREIAYQLLRMGMKPSMVAEATKLPLPEVLDMAQSL